MAAKFARKERVQSYVQFPHPNLESCRHTMEPAIGAPFAVLGFALQYGEGGDKAGAISGSQSIGSVARPSKELPEG
jgi:hypothetical protein